MSASKILAIENNRNTVKKSVLTLMESRGIAGNYTVNTDKNNRTQFKQKEENQSNRVLLEIFALMNLDMVFVSMNKDGLMYFDLGSAYMDKEI